MSTSRGVLGLSVVAVALAGGCGPADENGEGEEAAPVLQAPAVAAADTTGAAIWAHLQESGARIKG